MPGPFHVYVHFPFCASRCPYCAFYFVVGRRDAREPYVAELALGVALYWREWQATLGTVWRTKEYETQEREASFGSLTFRRALAQR